MIRSGTGGQLRYWGGGVPGNCSRLSGQSLETEKPGTPTPVLCIMEGEKRTSSLRGIGS